MGGAGSGRGGFGVSYKTGREGLWVMVDDAVTCPSRTKCRGWGVRL